MLSSESDLDKQEEGFWIVDSSASASTELDAVYSLTLYQRIKNPGWVYHTYTNYKLCQFYSVKCKRTVPRIGIKPTRFECFTDELKIAVSGFKANAERSGDVKY